MEEYKKTCHVSIILECFGVKRSTFYRWKQECKNSQKRDEIADKIEQLCMENHFIYGYRTITRLLKKVYNLVVLQPLCFAPNQLISFSYVCDQQIQEGQEDQYLQHLQ